MLNYEFPNDTTEDLEIYAFEELKNAFNYISFEVPFTFDFPQGGCQQRSHLMSLILLKNYQIQHSKIWLFAPAALYNFDERALFIEDKNQLSYNNLVHWNYHTAPVIKVANQISYDWIVIDPSLQRNAPILLKDWLKKIGNSELGKYTFLNPEKYFFNCQYNEFSQLTNVFDGSFFEYINPAKDNLMMEKGLAINDMAMAIYQKHIYPLLQHNSEVDLQKLTDLKDVFGNATALDLLFSQNLSGNTDNTSYRYVLNNYGKIMKEAKVIFHEKLLFWTKFCNKII